MPSRSAYLYFRISYCLCSRDLPLFSFLFLERLRLSSGRSDQSNPCCTMKLWVGSPTFDAISAVTLAIFLSRECRVVIRVSYRCICWEREMRSGCHPTDMGRQLQASYPLPLNLSTQSKCSSEFSQDCQASSFSSTLPLIGFLLFAAKSCPYNPAGLSPPQSVLPSIAPEFISASSFHFGYTCDKCTFLYEFGGQYMNSSQQFELRIGVYHHPSLKTSQLIEFLQNEANDYLANELPQNLMIRQAFIAVFDVITDPSKVDPAEYVGFIILYSSSSLETFLFAKNCIPQSGDEFLLFVEMDNTQKKSNEVKGAGEEFSREKGLLYIRLTLRNPEDLVVNLQRSIYLLIENYYYPNEEERHKTVTGTANYQMQISPSEFVLQYSDSEQKIIASEEKEKVLGLIEQASLLRTGREKEMVAEQQAIDQSIENVERVLNNINSHIRQKLDSNWFTNLKQSLYKPIEKQSRTYNKIKLTQEFIDDPPSAAPAPIGPRESIYNSKYNSSLQQSIKRLQSALMKVVVVLQEQEHGRVVGTRMAEVEVFENSSFDQLAANALRKLELSANQKNLRLMRDQIRNKVETYIRQLSRGVRNIEKQRTFQRSYLAVQKK